MTALLDDLGRLLHEADVGFYSTTEAIPADAVPIVIGAMPPQPATALSLDTYPGGPEPDTRNGWSYPRLQVRVRSDDPLAAIALDEAAYAVLQAEVGKYPADLPGSTWLLQDCYTLQSVPEPLGQDTEGRHEYVRNYQLAVEPA